MDASSHSPSLPTSESAASWLRAAARAFGVSDARSQGWIPRGSLIDGRYHVVRLLGAGGMAVVLLAWDLELDRAVALKLYDHDVHDAARSRTLREARAMAALAHPNVATIYGVGVHDARLYIAMEFVDGGTLGAWLRREHRTHAEVIGVFVACARGLAAAHAAGIVHGDIKPSNLLIDGGGRPRVADFGLARLSRTGDAPGCVERHASFFGTPRYAAPEQHTHGEIDGRADQFGLCVALYEALYHEHPFVGDGGEALTLSIRTGRRRVRRQGLGVPRSLARALDRGLAHAPADRFAKMDELADALQAAPWRRRLWIGALAVAVGGSIAAGWRASPGCTTAAGIDRVWNTDRQHAIADAFAASGSPFHREALSTMATALDEWSARWRDARADACMARSDGPELVGVEHRVGCLDRQLVELDAVIAALGHADRETVTRARDILEHLPDPRRCESQSELAAHDEAVDTQPAQELDEARERLARSRTALDLGRYAEATELAHGVAVGAIAQARAELRAEALLLLGLARRDAADLETAALALTDAHYEATAAGDDRVAARAATELLCVLARVRGGSASAERWLRAAEAALLRSGTTVEDELRLGLCRGDLRLAEARHDDAEDAYRAALVFSPMTQASFGLAAQLHAGIGNALIERGQLSESLAAYDRARSIIHEANRESQPDGIAIASARAEILTRMGRPGEGLAAQLACLEAAILALGSESAALPAIYDRIALSLLGSNAPALALAYARRGLEVAHARPSAATVVPSLLSRLSDANEQLGRGEAALRVAGEAVAAAEAAFGLDHAVTGKMVANYGVALLGTNRDNEAAVALARGLEIFRGAYGDTHPTIGIICFNLAVLFDRRGQPTISDAYLEWAERVAAANDDERIEMAAATRRGLYLMNTGELQRALPILGRAVALAQRLDPGTEQKLRRDIGYIHLDLREPEAALASFTGAHELAVAGGNARVAAQSMLGIATASLRMGRRTAARRAALEALALAQRAEEPDEVEAARRWLGAHGR